MTYREYYNNALQNLQNYLDFAIDISDATSGKKNLPWDLARGHQLYNRLTITCLSFIHLLPRNRYFPSKMEFWDFFSTATLARNFIENYYSFYYICVDKITTEESDFRLLLLTYHLNNEKYKFYKESNQAQSILAEFEENLPKDMSELSDHPFMQNLDNKTRGDLLKGKNFKYLSNKDISERIPFDTSEFEPLYRFFSNHAHSTPLAFFTQNNERGRGLENETEVSYISMAIDFVTKYLLVAMIDMTNLFPDCVDKLNSQKLAHIRQEFEQKTKGS